MYFDGYTVNIQYFFAKHEFYQITFHILSFYSMSFDHESFDKELYTELKVSRVSNKTSPQNFNHKDSTNDKYLIKYHGT